ncbi:MAG: DUF169 domain-containing protein [Desulfosarcina sp.]|nr:DUF169 domain-containing protein [Desulfobacterales bacterium]
MASRIAEALKLKFEPVALIWSDDVPEQAIQFKEGKWGCVMWMLAHAAKGKTAACGRKTFGCFGGGVGLGFGAQYKNFPGGEDCFCHFLSIGNEQWETGRQVADKVKPFMRDDAFDHFMHGERYLKSAERVRQFIAGLPITDIPKSYVVFKPLATVDTQAEDVQVVVFCADPDQLSALTILANYDHETNENVIMPYAAGCQTIGIYPYREAQRERPRAVVGLTDISARTYIRQQLGDHLMTFTVPLAMFREMENNVAGSFLERPVWQKLAAGKGA